MSDKHNKNHQNNVTGKIKIINRGTILKVIINLAKASLKEVHLY